MFKSARDGEKVPAEKQGAGASLARKILNEEFSAFDVPAARRKELLEKYEQYADGIAGIIRDRWGPVSGESIPEKMLFSGLSEAFYSNLKAGRCQRALMSTALETGHFNCYNSALLFADVCERLGKDVDVVLVPEHVLLAGKVYAFETTARPELSVTPRTRLDLRYKWVREGGLEMLDASGLSWIGSEFMVQKKHTLGIEYYLRALEADPGNFEVMANLGIAFDREGLEKEALHAFNRAIVLSPSFSFAWAMKGNLHLKRGRDADSLACFDKALEFEPKNSLALANRGSALLWMGRKEEAVESLRASLKIDPDSEIALTTLGCALTELGDFAGAIAEFDKAVKIGPESTEAWFNRGIALANLEKFEQAEESFRKAREIDPAYAAAWKMEGAMLDNEGKKTEANALFRKALDLDPSDSQAAEWLSELEARTE